MKHKKMIIGIVAIMSFICIIVLYFALHRMPYSREEYSKAKITLFEAIEEGDAYTVSKQLDEYPKLLNDTFVSFPWSILVLDTSNNTPLMEACRYDQNEIIVLLVERGADVNALSTGSAIKYPIIEVLKNDNYDMAWYLIENNAYLTVEGERDNVVTAILNPIDNYVEMEQQYKLIKYFVDHNVSLKLSTSLSKEYDDKTVFRLAVFERNKLVVRYLLQNRMFTANECVEPDGNLTGLHLILKQELEKKQYDSTYNYLINAYSMCKLLLEYGADKTLTDNEGKIAYDYAVELGDQELMEILKP